uniref:Ribonuclease E n=1 Tax=Lophosiphonia teges TaxID=2007110 RepID=A0A1Z1MVE5_9FLOR|nr:ribonuclease E [Polysiphonia teges]
MHVSDLKALKRNPKYYRINDLLYTNQLILVQLVKEPTINKGPRLTSNIHLHGKYLVLMPFCNIILISNRIYDSNESVHLYALAVLIKPKFMGILIKSSAQGVSESLILDDLHLLLEQWCFLQKQILISSAPSILYTDEDLIKKVIRDFYEQSVKKIVVDSEDGLKLVYYYLQKWSYISVGVNTKLQLYRNHESVLDKFDIINAIKNSLMSKVNLLYGGYLFIEHYEALTVIDVNSGSFNRLNNSQETILRINFYAAIEVAYQLRVRNINGVIIVDFIDMYSQRDQLKLIDHFNKLLICDECSPKIIHLSQLGLLELTRRRKSQSLREIFTLPDSKHFGISCANSLYIKLFFNISYEDFRNQYFINRSIRSLFFTKNFSNCKVLGNKLTADYNPSYTKYFSFLDSKYVIRFLYPKANYIVPLFFYLKLTKYLKTYK